MTKRHVNVRVYAGGPGITDSTMEDLSDHTWRHAKELMAHVRDQNDVFVVLSTNGLPAPFANDLAEFVKTWLADRNLLPE